MNQPIMAHPAQLFNPRCAAFRSNPYPNLHQLNQLAPVCYRPDKNDWLLTAYDDISAVLKSSDFGRSALIIQDFEKQHVSADQQSRVVQKLLSRRMQNEHLFKLWMALQNPPDQTRIRKLCQPGFNSKSMQTLRSFIQTRCDELIGGLVNQCQIDIIRDFAYPITIETTCKLLGIELNNQHQTFYRWTQELALMTDLDITAIDKERGLLAMSEMVDFFKEQINSYRKSSTSNKGLLGRLTEAHKQGHLSKEELISNCILLFFAGQSTTKHLIAICIRCLIENPAQRMLLQNNPALIAAAVLEALRYDSPLQSVSRLALCDTQINGQQITKHQVVHCLIGAANRDHLKFTNPDRFDITRQALAPISFGHGIHYCLGAQMAKFESEIAVMSFMQQFPAVSVNKKLLEWEKSFVIHGLSSMPVNV